MTESSTPTFNEFSVCDKAQESKNCSLIAQRSGIGRLGRRLTFTLEPISDSILASAVCRSCGNGMSMNTDDLLKLEEGSSGNAELWNDTEKEECDEAYQRACSCAADIKLSSADKKEQEDGLRLLESSADADDGYGLFRLGLVYERGDVGVEENERYARELYEKCKKVGYPDVEWFIGTMGEKDKLKPENKEWDRLLFRMRFNTIAISKLDLSSPAKRNLSSLNYYRFVNKGQKI